MSKIPSSYDVAESSKRFFEAAVKSCVEGKVDALNLLVVDYLKQNPQISAQELFQEFRSEGKTLLHVAAASGQLKVIEFIISKCSNIPSLINLSDANGFTPLIYATISENSAAMRTLIDNGADVNAKNSYGATSLHFAAGDGSVERITLLIQAGATVNADSKSGSPLHWAAGKAHANALRYISI